MQAKLFTADFPHVSTFEFHEKRERVAHWEQPHHYPRLKKAFDFTLDAVREFEHQIFDRNVNVVDLGCGDGGLLAQLTRIPNVRAFGYDFQPSNPEGWLERGVLLDAMKMDFVKYWDEVKRADLYIMTEVLEHLANPHAMLSNIRSRNARLIASSPWTEHAESHDECHAWAWDNEGYENMITNAGFVIVRTENVGMFQVVYAK